MTYILPEFRAVLADLRSGDDVLVLTWLDRADRDLEALDGTPIVDVKPVIGRN